MYESVRLRRTVAGPSLVLIESCSVRRYLSGEVRAIIFDYAGGGFFEANGIAALANGMVLFSCSRTHSLYSLDPTNGKVELVAGQGGVQGMGNINGHALSQASFYGPGALAVSSTDQCVFVCDSRSEVMRRVTLPPEWFVPTQSAAK